MADRYQLDPLPDFASPSETTALLQGMRAQAQAALNTIDDETNLVSYYLHGVGRVDGCVLTKDESGRLHLANGWFFAGSGVAQGTPNYFPGARLNRINALEGYIELVGSNAPPSGAVSYGHMSALGDVLWAATPQVGADGRRPNGRWLIGKVTTDASGAATAVDASVADILSPYGAPSSGGGDGGGDGGTPASPYWEDYQWSRADKRPVLDVYREDQEQIQAQLGKLAVGKDPFPAPFDQLAQQISLNTASIAEGNPHSIERGEVSAVGLGFGHGQNDTPDFTPDTGDPLELPFDATHGIFGP